ncbi:glutathione S-transferase [Boeremia exigua]|uniref:glutathione S-transferase n=1 Tax=Boeremia exigua TaxID=749465 RepID=UPI001E8DD7C7|nr:glutathione S-transferase [Boeremia exigua]KAH6643614.1 glutathione S-transferase [Boeremia exigua]
MVKEEIHKYGTNDGWHGVISEGGEFPVEKDRYHLYIGLFCPFAHRANLVRHIKHLQPFLPISIVKPYPKGEPGWRFDETYPNATPDHLYNSRFLHQIYFRDDPAYSGKYSVPLLWDKKEKRVVSSESMELLKWLPRAFDSLIGDEKIRSIDFYPEHLRAKIDEVTPWLTSLICHGVYKAGFNTTQDGYNEHVVPLFAALNKLEKLVHSNGGPYILGDTLTELDLLAYPTVVRFDTVYAQHFKTNLGTIRHDYPVLNNWLKNLYHNIEGFKESTDFQHIKENYTKSHPDINPLAITPLGPYPEVEEGYRADWAQLKPGEVRHPLVIEAASKL